MKNLKILLLLCGLFLNSTPSKAQYYTLTVEEAREIFKIALQSQSCDSLVKFQEEEINRGLMMIVASDSLADAYKDDLIFSRLEIRDLKEQVQVNKDLTADQKRKKRKWMGIAGAGWGLLFIALFFGN